MNVNSNANKAQPFSATQPIGKETVTREDAPREEA